MWVVGNEVVIIAVVVMITIAITGTASGGPVGSARRLVDRCVFAVRW